MLLSPKASLPKKSHKMNTTLHEYYFRKQASHVCSLAHNTKAAIAPRTSGIPVTAALAAPAPVKACTVVDGEATGDGKTVGGGATVVGGCVIPTLGATVGVTDSVADWATTEDNT